MRPEYAAARPGEQSRSVISPARAGKELGWKPEVGLDKGLRRTFEFFRGRVAQAR
jgi:UDP-glucose 4-epimerase